MVLAATRLSDIKIFKSIKYLFLFEVVVLHTKLVHISCAWPINRKQQPSPPSSQEIAFHNCITRTHTVWNWIFFSFFEAKCESNFRSFWFWIVIRSVFKRKICHFQGDQSNLYAKRQHKRGHVTINNNKIENIFVMRNKNRIQQYKCEWFRYLLWDNRHSYHIIWCQLDDRLLFVESKEKN